VACVVRIAGSYSSWVMEIRWRMIKDMLRQLIFWIREVPSGLVRNLDSENGPDYTGNF
jgi:hypothetical protein